MNQWDTLVSYLACSAVRCSQSPHSIYKVYVCSLFVVIDVDEDVGFGSLTWQPFNAFDALGSHIYKRPDAFL